MAQYINVNTVNLRSTIFKRNQNLVNADLRNTPFVNNSMFSTFSNCPNLRSVVNIPSSVVDMNYTFAGSGLINAPTIPNSVTTMWRGFMGCTNLVNGPKLPNSVVNTSGTFTNCTNLVSAPNIPASSITTNNTFSGCINLTGQVVINSTIVRDANHCFTNTSDSNKYVYIPFKYTNDIYTLTYNTFTSAGYDTTGTLDKVYLKPLILGDRDGRLVDEEIDESDDAGSLTDIDSPVTEIYDTGTILD